MIDTIVKLIVTFEVHILDARKFMWVLEDYLSSDSFAAGLNKFLQTNYPEYELS
jgi:hypothetical protein